MCCGSYRGRLRAIKLFLWLHGSAEYIKTVGVCGIASSMLSDMETRSLGLNTLGTYGLQPCHNLSMSVVRPPLPGFNQY